MNTRGEFLTGAEQHPGSTNEIGRHVLLADAMVEGLQLYVGDQMEDGTRLRKHQAPALQELSDTFVKTRSDTDRRILIPSPPNFGKSTMAAFIARSAGIGRPPAAEGQSPFKGLLLTSRSLGRKQLSETFAALAPDIRVREFTPKMGHEAFDDTDMLSMTYASCWSLEEDSWQSILGRTDLIMIDEAHRALGDKISKRLTGSFENRAQTLIALTATPELADGRNPESVLGIKHVLQTMTPREAILAGVSNSVQLIALQTSQSLDLGARKALTDEDTLPLMRNQERNALIVSIMRSMGATGIRGLVQCTPGQNNKHAIDIAALASNEIIVDPRTGRKRQLRVEAVGAHRHDNTAAIAAHKAGELDALTSTKFLNEAYDDAGVRYLISASPSSSGAEVGQFVGRGARLGDPRPTKIFYLVDTIYGRRGALSIKTPFTIFGHGYQGEVIAPMTAAKSPGPTPERTRAHSRIKSPRTRPPSGSSNELDTILYENALNALRKIPAGTIVDEILISQSEATQIPDGYVELMGLDVVQKGLITHEGISYRMKDKLGSDGLPLMRKIATDGRRRTYVSAEAAELINKMYVFENNITKQAMQSFLDEKGWPKMSTDMLVTIVEQNGLSFYVQKRMIRMHPKDMRVFMHKLAEIPFADAQETVLISDMTSAMGEPTSSAVLKWLRDHPEYGPQLTLRRRGRNPGSYQPVQALPITAARRAIHELLTHMPRFRKSCGHRGAAAILGEIQASYQAMMDETGLVPRLDHADIDAFIDAVYKGDETASKPPAPVAVPAPPSDLINKNLRLVGPGWHKQVACKGMDPDVFINKSGPSVPKALRACFDCKVKADCLLESLETASQGTAGGLRNTARMKLLPLLPEIKQWLHEVSKPQQPPAQS